MITIKEYMKKAAHNKYKYYVKSIVTYEIVGTIYSLSDCYIQKILRDENGVRFYI